MQAHEGIRRRPMSARLAVAIDERDVGVSLGAERVDEGHAHGTSADNEVVGVDVRGHRALLPDG